MFDVIIIGCGVVGAACAYNLSKFDLKVGILEAENDVAIGTTKANSAILHAGYDPAPGTLMAKFNVRGNLLTKEICKKLQVKCEEIGSLVVAFSPPELEKINELYSRGIKNGVPNMEIWDRDTLLSSEPNLAQNALGALYAPSAAIVDPWDLCLAMAQTAVKNGAELFLENRVLSIKKLPVGFLIATDKGEFETATIFNASGIFAEEVHNMVAKPAFKIRPHSGQYYLLDKGEGERVHHVIFQCPIGDTKGVLVAPTVHGNLIVGPDSTLVEGENLKTTSHGLSMVRQAAQKSVPQVDFRQNIRNFAGLRAVSDKEDFIIGQAPDAKGFFDLSGIKSPGLTAAAAIGEYSVQLLKEYGISLQEKENYCDKRQKLRFNELSQAEKIQAIKQNPSYAKVICRCETVTEGEILDCLKEPIPPVSIDGVKRRTGTGMGRCQGGFCGPKVLEIISRELKKDPIDILQDKKGSYILTDKML
ncbi:MAG: NAD(P)/FAD-dependent oxidoreductase [Oscillospiraceae bacterium]